MVTKGIDKKEFTRAMEELDRKAGVVKDKRWKKWLMLGVTVAMVGTGIAVLGVGRLGRLPAGEAGGAGIGKMFQAFTGKPLSDIPAEKFTMTREEKDRIRIELRAQGILDRLNHCPVCGKWVCAGCFDGDEGMCVEDSQASGWW